jgi:hypothetical protein
VEKNGLAAITGDRHPDRRSITLDASRTRALVTWDNCEIFRSKKSQHRYLRSPHCGTNVMAIRLLDARLCAALCTIVPPESNNSIWEQRASPYVGVA